MPQISFPLDKAHQALDEFLNGHDNRDHLDRRYARTILDENGEQAVAVILPAQQHRELLDAWHAWQKSQEPNEVPDLPPGYRPYLHSPNATTDRLLPHEPLHTPLAHALYSKPFDDLDDTEQGRVIAVAISCLLRTTLDPDTQGVVPILALSHDRDDPNTRQYWQLVFKTDVDGLFLRATANGFFGDQWAIVTGSGWKLVSGWFSREDAARAAAAIGRAVPFVDWMAVDPEDLTDRAKKAIAATISRYHFTGLREDRPEPEPVAEHDTGAQQPAPAGPGRDAGDLTGAEGHTEATS
jgi:hypothetical protein